MGCLVFMYGCTHVITSSICSHCKLGSYFQLAEFVRIADLDRTSILWCFTFFSVFFHFRTCSICSNCGLGWFIYQVLPVRVVHLIHTSGQHLCVSITSLQACIVEDDAVDRKRLDNDKQGIKHKKPRSRFCLFWNRCAIHFGAQILPRSGENLA